MTTVGFVGLGNMGLPMAMNLAKSGFEVRGFDLSEAAVAEAKTAGVIAVSSAQEAAEDADFFVTMLPKGEHVRSVLLGDEGVLNLLPKHAVVIDSSTIDVATAVDLYEAGKAAGLQVLDAPVSGGVSGSTAGTLTFMIGGDEDALEKAAPLFEVMGARMVHCGPAGTGQVAKVCNNLVFGVSLAGVAEAFVLGERLGLSSEKIFDVISTSSGNCWALTAFAPRPGLVEGSAADNDYAPKFAAALLAKDLGLARMAGDKADMDVTMSESARALVEQVVEDFGNLDCSAVIKVIETSTK